MAAADTAREAAQERRVAAKRQQIVDWVASHGTESQKARVRNAGYEKLASKILF